MRSGRIEEIARLIAAGEVRDGMAMLEAVLADAVDAGGQLIALLRRLLPESADAAREVVRRHGAAGPARDAMREHFVVTRAPVMLRELLAVRRASGSRADGHVDAALASGLVGEHARTRAACREAIALDPGHVHAWNHLGRAEFYLGNASESEQALRHATALAPGHAVAWSNLGHVLRARGDATEAAAAFDRAHALDPDEALFVFNLGTALLAKGQATDALACFEQAARLAPAYVEARENVAVTLQVLRRFDEARAVYRELMPARGMDPAFLLRQARFEQEAGNAEAATALLERAVALPGAPAEIHAELAGALEQSNALERAEWVVEQGLRRYPGDPALLLEHLKLLRRRKSFAQAIQVMQGIPLERVPPRLRQWLHHERAMVLDATGDHPAAFREFEACNDLARRGLRAGQVDSSYFDALVDAMLRWTGEGAPASSALHAGDTGRGLCFLIGFPRSGTTLLDVFLDGHPHVASVEEKPTVEPLLPMLAAMPAGFPAALASPGIDPAALRARYRQALAAHLPAGGRASVLMDKMPIRTLYAAFLHRLFPEAKFLFALRHPCDVVLSNFMQHYAANEIFVHFYTLAESARAYARVMSVWQSSERCMAPSSTMAVRYEDLVGDAAGTIEQVCAFLGVHFSPAMLDRGKTLEQRGRIATNSYHQVSQPTYRTSIGRWQQYASQMQPVLPVLAPWAEMFGYSIDA